MSNGLSLFICPDCGSTLSLNSAEVSCAENHKFDVKDGIYNLLPHSLNPIMAGDAVYHNQLKEEWVEINQINTLRNLYYHGKILDFLYDKSNNKTVILELGGGVGFDLEFFLSKKPIFKDYIFSEIHHEMVLYVKNRIPDDRIIYCLADAAQQPVKNAGIVLMIATLHHLPDWQTALARVGEKVTPGGYIICGIEPNRLWLDLTDKAKNLLKRISSFKGRSGAPGDDQAEGFKIDEFRKFADLNGLQIESLTPIWFFCGFLHKSLEYLFKIFKLQKRLRVFAQMEKLLIAMDQIIFKLPFMEKMSFHYTVIFKKPLTER